MSWELSKTLDGIKEETIETANEIHEKVNDFHEAYVSRVIPDLGKYGDAAKFAAEMVPGISEYNAIKDGDWVAFAIAAGVDISAIAIGAFTAGAGYAAVKGSTSAAKTGVKVATKEIAEAGAKKAMKEMAETGTEKLAKELLEEGSERLIKETLENGSEKIVKESIIEKTAKEITEATTQKVAKETVEAGIKEVSEETVEKTILKLGDKIDKTLFPEYIDEVQKITNREIPINQKKLLEKALKENDFMKLSPDETKMIRDKFRSQKPDLILEWEKMTGQEWPKYTEDVLDNAGNVVRIAGYPYDVHHIIELCTNGPNEWWNLHPAKYLVEHQKGIHAAEITKKIFG